MLGLAVLQVASAPPAAADESCDLTDFNGVWLATASFTEGPAAGIPLDGGLIVQVDPAGQVVWRSLWSTDIAIHFDGTVTTTSHPPAEPGGTLSWVGSANCTSMTVVPAEPDGTPRLDLPQMVLSGGPRSLVGTQANGLVAFVMTWTGPFGGDADSDGTLNEDDRCPLVAGLLDNGGCLLNVELTTTVVGAGRDGDEVPLVWYGKAHLTPKPVVDVRYRWLVDGVEQSFEAPDVAVSLTEAGHHTLRVEVVAVASGAVLGADEVSIDPPSGLRARFTFQFATKQPSKYTFDGSSSGGSVAKYRWTVDGKVVAPKPSPTLAANFAPGPHDVTLAVQETGTGRWSDPYTRHVVAYRLKLAGMGETDAVAKPVLAATDSICSGSGFEIEPKSNWWTSLSVVQTGLKRNYKASVPEVPGLGEIAVPPASVVDVGGVTVPYRVRFTGGCFDDLQQKVEATADLTGNSALLMNAAEIAVGILGSPVSLREVFTAPQAIVGKQRTVIKLLGRMPHLTEAGQCLISGGVGATGCVAGALGAIIASPSERQDLATVVKTLGDMRPDHAIALQAVQNRLADARNAFDAYTAALRRCVGSTALPPQYDIVNFGVQFIAPVPVCTAGTPAVRPARAAAVVSARIDLAFAVVAAFPLGQVNTVAQVFQVTSDYLARTVAGALVDHLKFETTASTEPIGT